jgi:hypothetical protein
MSDMISKLRESEFWAALKANAIGSNPITSLYWSNQMILELTSAKNAFGHQASNGVCEDGASGLCVCQDLIKQMFDHAPESTEGLLRLVAANVPCGIALNFKAHAALIADAVSTLYESFPHVLNSLERADSFVRKRKMKPEPRVKAEPPIKFEECVKVEECVKQEPKKRRIFVEIGGVDRNELMAAMNCLFGI